jgi:isopentenyl-diphosphate Delta-isomerase
MTEVTPTSSRKADHIKINLNENVRSSLTTGLERYRFRHRALPELNFSEVSLHSRLFDHDLDAPILISSMTGGTNEAERINTNLAIAAQESRIAMGVGSQRAAIENPELSASFQIRKYAPDILLFANLGAVQLNYGFTGEHCQRAIDMIQADALILHFNALQEAVQPEGETRFAGLAKKVEAVCRFLDKPVIAKEVGWGFSEPDIELLYDSGVDAIDVAGAGGTSWSQVEMFRAKNDYQARLAGAFIGWGIPTVEAILNVKKVHPTLKIIASGGLLSGVDIAKCLALGAVLGGMAGPFLKTAAISPEKTLDEINLVKQEIRICMFSTGSASLASFAMDRIEKIPN